MEQVRIVVFGTTEMAADHPVLIGQTPVHEETWRGRRSRWYSTGRLERALEMGIEVCVCSVRPAFGEHDAWWLARVPEARVFAPRIERVLAPKDAHERFMVEPWRRFFAHAGLSWPDDGRDGLEVRLDLDGSRGVLYGGYLAGFGGAA